MEQLGRIIAKISNELVQCKQACDGIANDRMSGIIPRCLYLQDNSNDPGNGAIVLGLNPGKARGAEKRAYLRASDAGLSPAMNSQMEQMIGNNKFYTRLRKLLHQLDLRGPILWTELIKCQNADGVAGVPSQQTARTCTDLYLKREVAAVPPRWPILAISREAFTAASYLFPNRLVIGVPHPTGSFGYFDWLLKDTALMKTTSHTIDSFRSPGSSENAKVIWLNSRRPE